MVLMVTNKPLCLVAAVTEVQPWPCAVAYEELTT